MKRRILCLTVCAILIASAFLFPCMATVPDTPEKVVYDRGDLFTDAEESELTNVLYRAWSQVDGCGFFVATHRMTGRYDPEYTGDDFLDDRDRRSSDTLVLLVITLDRGTYYYNMYTYGKATNRIRDPEVDYILDHADVYENLKAGRLAEGAGAFFSLASQAYEDRIAGASYVAIGIVSFGIALIIGMIACVSVKAAYSMKQKSVDYPLNRFAKLELTGQNDVFMGSFVTQRIIESSSGGRGGGGRGGGGGHRGGR